MATHHGSEEALETDDATINNNHFPFVISTFNPTEDTYEGEKEDGVSLVNGMQHGASKVAIPSQKEVEAYLVDRRKQELLERYG
jgi:hypothetical protein